MSVIVGGADPDTPPAGTPLPGRSRTGWTVLAVAAAALTVFGLVLLPSSPVGNLSADPDHFADASAIDTGRWIPIGESRQDAFNARRLGDRYFAVVGGNLAWIASDGSTGTVDLGGGAARITSAEDTVVAHGSMDGRPALWTSTDGRTWLPTQLPWEGSVQAVAIGSDRLVVLGVDTRRDREIIARSLDKGWAVQAADIPDTGLVSTGTGFVGRGRLADGTTGYLYSRDGLNWEQVGPALSLHEGDVASLHYEDGGTILRTPGVAGDIRAPATPVSALWRVGDRIWLQTPGVVWWSTDGTRWSPLRLDRRHGISQGAPLLLPFEDRALVSVGGARGVPRQIFTWILGA